LVDFSNEPVSETREITEYLYIDVDLKGNIVSMTIEHAKEQANITEIAFYQMEK